MAANIGTKYCQSMCIQRFVHIITPPKSIVTKIPDHARYTCSRVREHIVSVRAAIPDFGIFFQN